MAESFWTVAQQVLILFLLIGAGAACGRTGLLCERAVKCLADLVLYLAFPCVIIQSFRREFNPEMLRGLLLAGLISLIIHAGSILLAHLVFRDREESRRRVLRFAVVFSNAGYMALPLQQALLGEEGVFYGAAYVAVFNLVLWSYGMLLMSGDRSALSAKKLLLNPGMIALAAGLPVFVFSLPLPEVIAGPISHLAALNTPLPMIVIGFYLARTDWRAALKDRRGYAAIALRLAVVPVLSVGGMLLFGVRGVLLTACAVAVSAPVAAASTMFAAKYGQDTRLSANLVSLSTLFSVATMPLIVSLTQLVG
ncbi:MAG: AEC family transporter [Clostridiales bacterium]|nr:AEC family transporter [Clostridiales bacterium]